MVESPGLRERKRRRTQAELVAAALDLIGRHGFAATTVDAIADAAEVSPRTFFRFFGSKEEVVLAGERVLFDAFVERTAAAGPGPLLDVLRAALVDALAGREEDWYPGFAAAARIIDAEPAVEAAALRLCTATTARLHERVRVVAGPGGPPEHVVRMTLDAVVSAWRLARAEWLAGGGDARRLAELVDRNCAAVARIPEAVLGPVPAG